MGRKGKIGSGRRLPETRLIRAIRDIRGQNDSPRKTLLKRAESGFPKQTATRFGNSLTEMWFIGKGAGSFRMSTEFLRAKVNTSHTEVRELLPADTFP